MAALQLLELAEGVHRPHVVVIGLPCRFYIDARENTIVIIGQRRVWIPPGFAVRSSPDHRIHVCFTDDVYGYQAPRCLFMPAQS